MIENPLAKRLQNHTIILASGSPRRKKFFEEFGLDFEVRPKPIDEHYPEELKASEISDYLAQLKAKAFLGELDDNDILITSDTVVWHQENSLEKAKDTKEAFKMLKTLSDDWHEVITSVCFTTNAKQKTVNHTTHVKFKALTEDEIAFYIEKCEPYDKAGAYGIQEWIGLIGIEEIKGAYTNVVGLPTHLVYETLMHMVC
ncbi:Maf family nucleotide pyrophosphatase [Allomuricauda sp. SCSIO 65647]|uniref:Maf family nucleotide pyrophosphatase n=1 Tax=Allomuricauda sp. SCSIO 65647 TaxID=2908843 RepID=UPI001F26B7BE|nr:Maf family nucleotide pyrophosphatase [Muricauda sp. SCSIO 65647]UJH67107.1 Maf family nucleotide pyrophosphatase [Muricauda sp. SCSIO 65647]